MRFVNERFKCNFVHTWLHVCSVMIVWTKEIRLHVVVSILYSGPQVKTKNQFRITWNYYLLIQLANVFQKDLLFQIRKFNAMEIDNR